MKTTLVSTTVGLLGEEGGRRRAQARSCMTFKRERNVSKLGRVWFGEAQKTDLQSDRIKMVVLINHKRTIKVC